MPLSLSLDQRKALVCHYIKTFWNAQEGDNSSYTSEHVYNEHQQEISLSYSDEVNFFASPPCVYLGTERLPIPIEQISQIVRKTFPDMHFTIMDVLGEEEKIVVRWLLRGTDLGGYKDHLPTGKSIRMTGITIFRLEQHTIVEEWIEADIAGMLGQLGFVSTPQPPRITVRRPGNVFPA